MIREAGTVSMRNRGADRSDGSLRAPGVGGASGSRDQDEPAPGVVQDVPGWARELLRVVHPALDATSRARWRWRLAGLLVIVAIGILDEVAGRFVALTAAYLVPVVVVTWFSAARTALGVAVFAAAVQSAAEWHKGAGSVSVMAWNGLARLTVYAFAALVILLLRLELEAERATARVDALTGVANRRGFRELAARELAASAREGRGLAVAFVDVDRLKSINDAHGHSAGDRAIEAVARHLVSTVRVNDVVGRLGGDEFAVLLAGAGRDEIDQILGRLGNEVGCRIGREPGDDPGARRGPHATITVGFSVGVATYALSGGRLPHSVDVMLSDADRVMYEAKRTRLQAEPGFNPASG